MSYGHKGHLGISAQQSYGTATNSWDYFPIISESLTTEIEQLVEEGMRARKDEPPTQEGLLTVAGDIVFEPHPILLGHLLRGVTGQASGTLVDSVTTWEFLPKQTDFTPNLCALPPFTLQIFRDVGSAWQFTDTVVNALTLEISASAIVRATASVMSRVSSLMTPGTPSFPAGSTWTWDSASLSIAGAGNGDMEAITISMENNVEGVSLLDGTKEITKFMHTGYTSHKISGTIDFADQTEYGAFRNQTEQRFLMTLTGETLTSSQNNVFTADLPLVRYTTFPINMGGPGRISVGFEGNGKFDTSSSYSSRYTLQNTRTAYAN